MKSAYRVHFASNADAISISDLFSLVKQYDKKFNPKPVNPLMLNDDGTPKVFYHSTNAYSIFADLHIKLCFNKRIGSTVFRTC